MSRIGEREKALRQQREAFVQQDHVRAVGPMTRAEARTVTDRINTTAGQLCDLLVEAHERGAWRALGYATWGEYVGAEIRVTRQRSYQLLDQGRVMAALREAVGGGQMSTSVDSDLRQGNDLRDSLPPISEAEARDIKPVLGAVVAEIRERVEAGEPRADVVVDVVGKHRPKPEPDDAPAATSNHEAPDPIAEWERAEKELEAARETIAALQTDDVTREVVAWTEKYHRLEGRLQQEARTRQTAQEQAGQQGRLLREIREILKVDRDRDILPAIRDLLR